MQTIGDHPDIVAIETTGYPWGYEEPKRRHSCKKCGHGIYEGEEYHEIDGKILCQSCVKGAKEYSVYCEWCGKEFDPYEDGFYKREKEINKEIFYQMICPECIEQDCKCCDE